MLIKETFELSKSRVFKIFYTGGDFAINLLGDLLFTTCGNLVKVLYVNDGSEKFSIGNPEDENRVSSFILTDDDSEIIITYTNDIVKRYLLSNDTAVLLHQFRGTHNAPIQLLALTKCSENLILATCGADYAVKIWNLHKRQCTHNFKGKSVVTAVCFINRSTQIIVGYTEGKVILFDLEKNNYNNQKNLQFNAHTSRITKILPIKLSENEPSGVIVFSCDLTVSILNAKTLERINFITLTGCIEDAVYLGGNEIEVLTVGEEGTIKIWSLKNLSKTRELNVTRSQLDNVVYCKTKKMIVASTAESDLIFVNFNTLTITKQFSGFNDEIYDSCYISNQTNCLAVASNAPDLRIYSVDSYCCYLVRGHTESILSIDSPEWDDYLLATASKDNSVMIWRIAANFTSDNLYQKQEDRSFIQRLATATGHTNSVTSIKFCHVKTNFFFVSVSNDSTLKLWSLNSIKEGDESQKLNCAQTFVAHSKDITSVDVSINDKLCVTTSMDKTAKLWHIDSKNLVFGIAGTLSGHKRGVWCAKFSKSRQVVATCSGDCTIKLFSLSDKNCLQTLSGHSFAVLSIIFVDNSDRLLSTDGGGLLKVWDLKDGICEKTIEAQTDKIWSIKAIAPNKNETEEKKWRYITVGSDSELIIWDDITLEVKNNKIKAEAKRLSEVQSLQNFIQQNKFKDALILTLDLAQPFQCLNVLKKLLEQEEADTELNFDLKNVICELNSIQLSTLLDYASQWNTNTKYCQVSQTLLYHILHCLSPEEILNLPNIENLVRSFLPYTNRHYERLSNLRTNTTYLNYLLSRIQLN